MHDYIADAICCACGSDNVVKIEPYKFKTGLFKKRSIVKCKDCDISFVHPMPGTKELAEYNENYFQNAHDGIPDDKTSKAFHSAINHIRAKYVFDNINQKDRFNVLEIGAGSGYFAQHWMAMNSNTQYFIVESDKNCQSRLNKNINIKVYDSIERIPSGTEFDLIVMSHVLEHVDKPKKILEELSKKLISGGVIFIEVPCLDYNYKTEYEPHTLFFNKSSLYNLVQKIGYSDVSVKYFGVEITKLKEKQPLVLNFYNRVKYKLINNNIFFPFSIFTMGLNYIIDKYSRLVVQPYHAHIEKKDPSMWVRCIAKK